MKLEKLIIYGFGRHENRTIELNAPITVFYGMNEAGKTTIQQFILQMLFGFSGRSQAHRRYEPKAGGKYGGQLHLVDPAYGRVVVERTAGKSAGDVRVWFEDGRRGGDAELGELLRGYDRASYEAIFSFSVHELQDLDAMTEQELTRTLLSSGTAGVDHAGKMESQLEREMGELFKKAGKLPLINRLSEELRQLEKELRDSKSRAETFLPATERLQQIKRRLGELEQSELSLLHNIKQAEKWQQGEPLLARQQQLQPLAEHARTQRFPEGGVRQYERLLDQKNEAQAEAAFLKSELGQLEQANAVPETQALSLLLDREAEWHQSISSLKLKSEERNRLYDELDRILKLCGMSQEQALSADVSLVQEEQLKKVLAAVQTAEEEQAFQSRRLEEERQRLMAAERALKQYLEAEPPEEQRERAEQWSEIAPQLQLAKAKDKQQSGTAANNRTALYLLAAIGSVGLIISLVSADLFTGMLALMAVGAALWLWLRDRKSNPLEEDALIKRYAGQEAEYEALLTRLSEYDKGLDERLDALEESKRKLAAWRGADSDGAMVEYRRFVKSLGFPEQTPRSTVLTLFDKLRDVHAVSMRLSRIGGELENLESEQQQWLTEAQLACGRQVSAEGVLSTLRTEWNARQQLLQRLEKTSEKRQQLAEQSRKCQERLDSLAQSATDLFRRAAVEDEDTFYRAAKRAQQATAAQEEMKMIQSQLAAIGEVERPDGFDEEAGSIAHFLETAQLALGQLANERKSLLEEQADKQQQTKHLLSDDSHVMKLQQLEAKKTEFQEAAKDWAINRAIVEAFRQTMEELKETKLPAVLALSESYFERLSDGEYVRLALTPEGDFEAHRRDGLCFRVIELSQATKEQAYLALRFALASSLKESHPFPILMDDPFVHFDRSRREQVIKLVEELQTNHQFIYFTCHETMRHAWPEAQQIDVANPERSIQA
ncbi:AAA family ATPase [Planococcus sp. ISL-109]|uniref:ATP-binding protein n=1 Tax=Planococcus sp. ISL-109 TaxID=2819166 RepID=UPI001BEB6723|nr:AAA family ATPase [Planococcus sp. ISL-109]MBT2583753.1 AAA family ATPase [Planococcus sp. ISL-109]